MDSMRGRKPTPVWLQLQRGDPRRIGKNKLQEWLAWERKICSTELLPCPAHLSGLARRAWDILSEELALKSLAAAVFGPMLEGLCVSLAYAVEADLVVAEQGVLIEEQVPRKRATTYRQRVNPAWRISRANWKLVEEFAAEFWFSPASMSALRVQLRSEMSRRTGAGERAARSDKRQADHKETSSQQSKESLSNRSGHQQAAPARQTEMLLNTI
jgi:phage terminase small subunit